MFFYTIQVRYVLYAYCICHYNMLKIRFGISQLKIYKPLQAQHTYIARENSAYNISCETISHRATSPCVLYITLYFVISFYLCTVHHTEALSGVWRVWPSPAYTNINTIFNLFRQRKKVASVVYACNKI